MTQTTDAIYEGGVLRPLTSLQLQEMQRVRIIVDSAIEPEPAARTNSDPLAGLSCDLGIADLAERFDDYRFGRRVP